MAIVKKLKRSRKYGVGKEIGGAVYVHCQYEDVFGDVVLKSKNQLPDGFEYHVVKYDERRGSVSFIESPDFDTADEPVVGEIITVKSEGTVTQREQLADPYIYHHKWLFVDDDYNGFDVFASKQRSEQWTALSNVDRTRIGNKIYWEQHVLPRLADSNRE